jgi:hypothetical protein
VLDEHRRYARVDDFHQRYASALVDPEVQKPVEVVQHIQIDGRPLLWFTNDKSEVVVDSTAFSDLDVADATGIDAGQVLKIGRLTERGKQLASRDLALFLLSSQVILTWVHIGSELCLEAEDITEDGSRRLRFSGEHTYYTSEENVMPLAFDLVISSGGDLAVQGR